MGIGHNSYFLIVAILLLAAGGWSQGALFSQRQPTQVPVQTPGVHSGIFRMENTSVRYAISVPPGYSPSNPVPLVLALHYGGNPNGAAQRMLLILVQPAFAELGAIIVAPESMQGDWSTAQNDSAVNALLDAVQASYRIDARKIAVTGFSMGGRGTWFYAAKYPGRFSAAVPVAGMPPPTMGNWRTPVLAVHSRNDEVMPIAPTEARIQELQKAGVRASLVALTGISHSETNRFVDGLRRAVPWLKETWK
jgi:predicted peptidase